ncbi:b2ea98cd-1e9c-4f08-92e5-7a2a279a8bb4 [Thermothielavioides terrestris]|uniref:B2ea98cd-1e9c-4f08-92e5-7a2a279a8bb4 n=1 Tax=Thermothielavioides terrestris TaxID=2587410 RepID=A0A446BJ66_9PEZI|nr:b2ea98cd-1e9c-4f08-92e5-7a2a279a8bb4 [Thermothielavioides terrestris]
MTTAHRPTFDPARGKEALRGPAYHQRLLPAYTQLKFRKPGQGGEADRTTRDLRAELEAAEAAHYAKLKGAPVPGASSEDHAPEPSTTNKRPLALTSRSANGENGDGGGDDDEAEEDPDAKRRRILAETRDIDADDDSDDGSGKGGGDDDSDDSDESSDDDEEAELQRELERVRRERAEKRAREERERQAAEQEARERDIARGNPLLNKPDFNVKRRWDEDVVFKNQARGTEEKGKRREFINDLLRSDFHKRFMNKYVR